MGCFVQFRPENFHTLLNGGQQKFRREQVQKKAIYQGVGVALQIRWPSYYLFFGSGSLLIICKENNLQYKIEFIRPCFNTNKKFFSLYRNNDISPSAFLTEKIYPRGSQPRRKITEIPGWYRNSKGVGVNALQLQFLLNFLNQIRKNNYYDNTPIEKQWLLNYAKKMRALLFD